MCAATKRVSAKRTGASKGRASAAQTAKNADLEGAETMAAQSGRTAAKPTGKAEDAAAKAAKKRAAGTPAKAMWTPPAHAPDLPAALAGMLADPRITIRRDGAPDPKGKCILYWMQRAQRGTDNHALDVAVAIANELGLPLVVYFAVVSNFPNANLRHYAFLNQGLPDIEEDLAARNVTFVMRLPPRESRTQLVTDVQPAMIIGDENPTRVPEQWRVQLAKDVPVPFWTVDADVIVPGNLFPKAQYAAYTMRPRLMKLLPEYLKPIDNPHVKVAWTRPRGFHGDSVREDITRDFPNFDRSVGPVEGWQGGAHAALRRLRYFIETVLPTYNETRNEPELDGTSRLSPYLHYGHIGPLTIALAIEAAVKKNPRYAEARDSFYNELITWRELCVNFVRYQPDYDNERCAEPWAQRTIADHAGDKREHVYTAEQMERAETYDALWNAAQTQMVHFGWMHNYMRMYWAKKILEWTPDVTTAYETCVSLNDKYFLDGRDPGGYAGIAWAIVGKFDRPWGSRAVFGKRRYMSGASTGKKFDSKRYIAEMRELVETGRDSVDPVPAGGR